VALFCNFGVNHTKDVTGRGITCATYTNAPPRNAADILELAENGDFWIGTSSVPLMKPWMGII
jgi:hypothetical protein